MRCVIRRDVLNQVVAAIVGNVAICVSGMIISWDTPMIPRLTNLTSNEIGWTAAVVGIGGLFGSLCGGLLVDFVGRKRMLWFSLLPAIVFYGMAAYRRTFLWLCVSRTIGGLCIGVTYTTIQMYLSEIAEKNIRGMIGSFPCAFRNVGNMSSYVLGSVLSPTVFCSVSLVLPIIGTILFFFTPETPYQLLMFGKTKEAERSLSWLRGGADITEEFQMMERYVSERQTRSRGVRELFRKRGMRLATLLNLLLSMIIHACGFLSIMVYADVIFSEAGTPLSGDNSVILCGGAIFAGNLFNFFMLDWLGRRSVLRNSAITSTILLAAVGAFFHLKADGHDMSSASWVPLALLIVYGVIANFGLLTVPSIILGEISPTNVKALALTISNILQCAIGTACYKSFQLIRDAYGMHTVFYMFATLTFLLTSVVLLILPETKGKTFEEIENELQNLTILGCCCARNKSSTKPSKTKATDVD